MKYSRNAVYTRVAEAISSQHGNGVNITSRYVPKPPSFPTCYVHEIDNNRPLQNMQLDYQDVQWESVFEAQVISDKAHIAASEAYAIFETIKSAFNALYYREFSEVTFDRGERFTIVGRFRRTIGGGDNMPNT